MRNGHSDSQLYSKYDINTFTPKITLESMKSIHLFIIIIFAVWTGKCFQLLLRTNI